MLAAFFYGKIGPLSETDYFQEKDSTFFLSRKKFCVKGLFLAYFLCTIKHDKQSHVQFTYCCVRIQ